MAHKNGKHHSSYKDGAHHSHSASQMAPMRSDPDRGHPMVEGEMPFDKGYSEQHGNESPYFPERKMRGNDYPKLQNEIAGRDKTKLERGKFTKIA
jgi:hypothetical protein